MRVNHCIHLGEGSIVCPLWKHCVNTIAYLGTHNPESLSEGLIAQAVLAGQVALPGEMFLILRGKPVPVGAKEQPAQSPRQNVQSEMYFENDGCA